MTATRQLLVCPECHGTLVWRPAEAECTSCGRTFGIANDIPDFLPGERRPTIEAFLARYLSVRHDERWTDDDRDLLAGLPFEDRSGRRTSMWRTRSRGLVALQRELRRSYGAERLVICEVGAGVAWMSYRLALGGHTAVACDVNVDERDGLGAARHYLSMDIDLVRARATMDRLPLAGASVDVVVCAASFHYAVDAAAQLSALVEAARILKPGGSAVILDSPVYTTQDAGERMIDEWTGAHGGAATARDAGYLVRDDIRRAMVAAGLEPAFRRHWMGSRWTANFVWQRLAGPREPATLPMILGRKPPASSG